MERFRSFFRGVSGRRGTSLCAKLALVPLLAIGAIGSANATIIYDTWLPDDGDVGNYRVEVTENAGNLDFLVTVFPWNAEVLGLFIDLGDIDVGTVTVSGGSPMGEISVFGEDTTSNSCGPGCNINGDVPTLAGDWEFVFRLGGQGFDGIQTFSWTTASSSQTLTESMLGQAAIRSQQLCSGDDTLDDGDSGCGGSDKSYSSPKPTTVPEPSVVALFGVGLAGFAVAGLRRRRLDV